MHIPKESTPCGCSHMPLSPTPPSKPPDKQQDKYFHEIGAEVLGNQLIIRVEKEKNKLKKKDEWEPPCDCNIVEIKRPNSKEGPKIVNGGDNNQILFRIHSKSHLNAKDDPKYKPQAIAYKVGPHMAGSEADGNCKVITVYPELGGHGAQEVYSDHITEGNQDIFLLKIKKKSDGPEQNKRNIEVELRTPKPPPPPPLPPPLLPPPPPPSSSPPTSENPKKPPKGKKPKKGKKAEKGKKKK